jgi:hypothetical protein
MFSVPEYDVFIISRFRLGLHVIRKCRAEKFHHSESDNILLAWRFELKALGDNVIGVLEPERSQAAVHVGRPYESGDFVACEYEDLSEGLVGLVGLVGKGGESCHGSLA